VPKPGADFPLNYPLVPVAAASRSPVALGKPRDFPSFGWDNEYGRKLVHVQDFRASAYKVTNGEFLAFVRSGGYGQRKFWSAEGWGWRSFRNAKWPTFWVPDGPAGLHRYRLRLMFDCVDMRWDWPVDCNYHEAKAYCAWLTEQKAQRVAFRLATEAEHVLMRDARDRPEPAVESAAAIGSSEGGSVDGEIVFVDGGEEAENGGKKQQQATAAATATTTTTPKNEDAPAMAPSSPPRHNLHLLFGSQSPVTHFPPTAHGFYDVFGNSQEWCEDHFSAFPGFRPHPFYEDFSAPCFAGLHQLIMGGSFISTGQLASKFARYQFRPHFFQHATFRVVQTAVGGAGVEAGGEEELRALERVYGAEAAAGFSPERPCVPFFETSCMDAAEPYVGDRPCCSKRERRTAR
jgi:formylglycine-generating enzyme required for sulfatase activity